MQASEPVFSVVADSSFHSFPTVFRGGLDDPALGNAVMLMLTFSIAEGAINNESLAYQTLALSHLRTRMASVEQATSLGTLGTILFLAGVEVCDLREPYSASFDLTYSLQRESGPAGEARTCTNTLERNSETAGNRQNQGTVPDCRHQESYLLVMIFAVVQVIFPPTDTT